MLLLLLLLLVSSVFAPANAAFRMTNTTVGTYVVFVAYDTTQSPTNPVVATKVVTSTPTTLGELYLVRVTDNASYPAVVNYTLGQKVFSTQIITAPNGCDNLDPALRIINVNCATSTVQAILNRDQLANNWYFEFFGPNKDLCLVNGGDQLSCFGKLHWVRQNVDTFLVSDNPNKYDILYAQYPALECAGGPYANIRCLFQVITPPTKFLVDTTSCTWAPNTARTFTGYYQGFQYDAYSGYFLTVGWSFIPDGNAFGPFPAPPKQFRILLRRTSTTSQSFWIEFADVTGDRASDYFNVYWRSNISIPSPVAKSTALIDGVSLDFYNPANGSQTCSATLFVTEIPLPPVLEAPPVVSVNNYVYRQFPNEYTAKIGNFEVGRLDENDFLVSPNCPDQVVCGGRDLSRLSSNGQRMNMTAFKSFQDYTLACDGYYPYPTFNSFGTTGTNGPLILRDQPQSYLCNAPFLVPENILALDNTQQRAYDCALQHMYCSGSSCGYCTQIVSRAFTLLSTHPYDYRGYQEYDFEVHQALRSPLTSAQRSCDQLHPTVFASGTMSPLNPTTPQFFAWYKRLLAKNCDPRVIVRMTIEENNCNCFQCVPSDFGPNTVITPACLCDGNYFSPCNYAFKDYEVEGQYQLWPPNMIAYLKQGESDGAAFDGSYTRCDPNTGWTGTLCQTATVPASTDFTVFQVGNPLTASNLTIFYALCNNLQHGSAFEGQPLTCYCNPGRAPIATMLPTNNTAQRGFPCTCPASSSISTGSYKANGVIYAPDGVSYDVCDTVNSGECFYDAYAGDGYCSCVKTQPLQQNSPFTTTVLKGGTACTCYYPLVPANSFQNSVPIVEKVCNAQGICCGGGNPDERCFDAENGQSLKGCVCTTNGVAGDACTCTAPKNLLFDSDILVGTGFAYGEIPSPSLVNVVTIQTRLAGYYLGGFAGCNVTNVTLTNNPFSSVFVSCELQTIEGVSKWICPVTQLWTYVRVATLETTPRCLIQAFATDVPVGGPVHNTNRFAGRLFAVPQLRQYQLYYRQQGPFASNGCTHYGDMCNANFDGAGCLAGVSSIRLVDGQQKVTVCLGTTQPAGGKYVVDALTGFGSCECQPFTSSSAPFGVQDPGVMTGRACQCASYLNRERNQVLQCGNHGPCIEPSFSLGFCDQNLARYLNDPLANPFVDVGGVVVNQYQQSFLNRLPSIWDDGLGDLRSVITVLSGGVRQSWFVSSQQLYFLQGVQGDVGQLCGRNFRDTLPIEFVDSPSALAPERAVADVTIWTYTGTYEETCDPGKLVNETGACSARVYCLPQWVEAGSINYTDTLPNYALVPCIAKQVWKSAESNEPLGGCLQTIDFTCSRSISIEQSSVVISNAQYPTFRCNVAFERVLDWMICMDKCDVDYVLQCPCTNGTMCYNDFDLGVAFGLYYNQIFNCQFPDDYAQWQYCNYKLIATTMNSERCFDSRNRSVLFMDDGLNYEYIYSWASRVTSQQSSFNESTFFNNANLSTLILNYTVNPTFANTAFVTFNYDVLYERTLNWLSAKDYEITPPLLEYCVQYFWWSVKTIELYQTLGPSVTLSADLQRYGADVPWFVLDSLKRGWLEYARPGVWQTISGIDPQNLLYMNVTFPKDLDVFVVYAPNNELCGVTFNVKAGETRTIQCDIVNDETAKNWEGTAQEYFTAVTDVAKQVIGANIFDTAFSSETYYRGMMQFFQGHVMDGDNGWKVVSIPPNFKWVLNGTNASLAYQFSNDQFLQQKQIPPQPNFQDYYVTVTPIVARNDWVEQFNNMSYRLYVLHESPSNPVWTAEKIKRTLQGETFYCRAFDYYNDLDLKFAADVFYRYFAPFRCSNDNQCQTTSRSRGTNCVFDETLYQPWYNGDPDVLYDGVGNEGGCANYQTPSQGYYDRKTFGQTCVSGYGPYTASSFTVVQDFQAALIARYDLDYYPIFDPTQYPFSEYVGPTADDYINQLDEFLSCRLIWNLRTTAKLCSGRGFAQYNNVTTQVNITTYALSVASINTGYRVFPRCSSLVLNGDTYELGTIEDARSLLYSAGERKISAIDDQVWLVDGGIAGGIEQLDLVCTDDVTWSCETQTGTLECVNPILVDPDLPHNDVQIVGYQAKVRSLFLMYLL